MKKYGEVEVELHIFFSSALDGGEWSVPTALWRRKSRRYVLDKRQVGPRAYLDAVVKESACTSAPLGRTQFIPLRRVTWQYWIPENG